MRSGKHRVEGALRTRDDGNRSFDVDHGVLGVTTDEGADEGRLSNLVSTERGQPETQKRAGEEQVRTPDGPITATMTGGTSTSTFFPP